MLNLRLPELTAVRSGLDPAPFRFLRFDTNFSSRYARSHED